jgi:hypothetical protein
MAQSKEPESWTKLWDEAQASLTASSKKLGDLSKSAAGLPGAASGTISARLSEWTSALAQILAQPPTAVVSPSQKSQATSKIPQTSKVQLPLPTSKEDTRTGVKELQTKIDLPKMTIQRTKSSELKKVSPLGLVVARTTSASDALASELLKRVTSVVNADPDSVVTPPTVKYFFEPDTRGCPHHYRATDYKASFLFVSFENQDGIDDFQKQFSSWAEVIFTGVAVADYVTIIAFGPPGLMPPKVQMKVLWLVAVNTQLVDMAANDEVVKCVAKSLPMRK